MPITEEQYKKVDAWRQRYLGKGCPLCGANNFEVLEILQLPAHKKADAMLVLPITCKPCGNVIMVGAMTLGII